VRRKGLRNETEEPDSQAIRIITMANRQTAEWVASFK
jgi:hypothetical protein